MNDKTGGLAFPVVISTGWEEFNRGMSLRDYFAAKAIQGLLSQPDERCFRPLDGYAVDADNRTRDEWRQSICEADAKHSYMVADAMLKEREK